MSAKTPEVTLARNAGRSTPASEAEVARQLKRMTRRSFATGGLAALTGLAGWRWLTTRPLDDGALWPLRKMLQFNEAVAEFHFSENRLAPTFERYEREKPKANGNYGLDDDFDPANWRLTVFGRKDPTQPLSLTLADIRALPRVHMVTELKCIEGWSAIVHWTGARLKDLADKFRLAEGPVRRDERARYCSLTTPGDGYYVGLDIASALHPQTLLCYEMNGAPLTLDHGAPLRLAIPVKYGIKNIKRIATIRFTDDRPNDFWAERGYDWHAGH